MAKIIFQGLNNSDNMMILNGSKRRVLSSQNIVPKINNEHGLIEFTIGESPVGAEYQAKTIKMIMDEFVTQNCMGTFESSESRYYMARDYVLEEFVETIENDEVLEF
jgi:hypothetical protein